MLNKEDAMLFGVILIVIAQLILIIKRVSVKKNVMITVFLLYIIMLVSVVFFPIPYQSKGYDLDYNYIPFLSIKNYFDDGGILGLKAVFGNIVLMVPWGVLFRMVFTNKKTWVFWLSTIVFCIGIEFSQCVINLIIGYRYRCVDVDDFILNITGAAIGYALYLLVFRRFYKKTFK